MPDREPRAVHVAVAQLLQHAVHTRPRRRGDQRDDQRRPHDDGQTPPLRREERHRGDRGDAGEHAEIPAARIQQGLVENEHRRHDRRRGGNAARAAGDEHGERHRQRDREQEPDVGVAEPRTRREVAVHPRGESDVRMIVGGLRADEADGHDERRHEPSAAPRRSKDPGCAVEIQRQRDGLNRGAPFRQRIIWHAGRGKSMSRDGERQQRQRCVREQRTVDERAQARSRRQRRQGRGDAGRSGTGAEQIEPNPEIEPDPEDEVREQRQRHHVGRARGERGRPARRPHGGRTFDSDVDHQEKNCRVISTVAATSSIVVSALNGSDTTSQQIASVSARRKSPRPSAA